MNLLRKFSVFALALTLLGSCAKEDQCKQLVDENAVLKEAAASRDQQLEEITAAINDVEYNLAQIDSDKKAIDSLSKGAVSGSQKERIQAMITNINNTVAANNERIAKLEARNAKNGKKNKSLEKLIASLKKQVAAKEAEIETLKGNIAGLNLRLNELDSTLVIRDKDLNAANEELSKRQSELEAKDNELNTAYIYTGSRKAMLEAGIIKKEGGVLGIGKSKVLNERLDNSKFTKVNIKNIAEIDLFDSKKPKLITSHPSESYTFLMSNGKTVLKIADQTKFWSLSRYLVVETEK